MSMKKEKRIIERSISGNFCIPKGGAKHSLIKALIFFYQSLYKTVYLKLLFFEVSMKLFSLCLFVSLIYSQPSSNIFVFDLSMSGNVSLSNGINITNRDGYDNQPSFSKAGTIVYYVSNRGGQTDIYAYDLSTKTLKQLTQTDESEYSPIQFSDLAMSFVRVDKDRKQRLYQMDLTDKEATLVHKETEGVGYHTWINTTTLAIFHIKKPFHLRLVDIREGDWKTIALHIGRSIYKTPKSENILFIQNEKTYSSISEIILNGEESEAHDVIRMKKGSTDFAVMTDGTFVMGNRSRLYMYNPKKDKDWVLVHTLNSGTISRIAINSQQSKIALVVE